MIGSGSVAGAVGALLLTLGMLALAIFLLKRIQPGGGHGARGVPLQVLKRVSVGPKQGIALILGRQRSVLLVLTEIAAAAVTGGVLFTEISEKKSPPAVAGRPISHHLVQFLELMGLPEMKLLKVNRKLRGGRAGQEAHPSSAEWGDVGPFTSLLKVDHNPPERLFGKTRCLDHLVRKKLDPFQKLLVRKVTPKSFEKGRFPGGFT